MTPVLMRPSVRITSMTIPEKFIDILNAMRVELAEGLGQNIPDGNDSDSRTDLASRADEIEEMIVGPLRGFIADLGGFVEELSAKCSDVTACVNDADNASDEYDEAVNAVQDYEGDDESDELANLQDEETNAENAMEQSDGALSDSRDEMITAISTLIEHIGEPKVSE